MEISRVDIYGYVCIKEIDNKTEARKSRELMDNLVVGNRA